MIVKPPANYDKKCYQIAYEFLEDADKARVDSEKIGYVRIEELAHDLAINIQLTIEDFLADL